MSESMDCIYRITSERIKRKIKESGLTYEAILSSDPKILSNIVQNRRTAANRFLVPDRVLVSVNEENVDEGLIPKVFFPSEYSTIKCNMKKEKAKASLKDCRCEILWGTYDERIKYSRELFRGIICDLYDEYSDPQKKQKCQNYVDIFCAFVPFAKAYTYCQIIFAEDNVYPAIFFGVREDDIIGPEKHLTGVADFLYCEIKKQYQEALIEYTNKKDTFSRIEKDFLNTFVGGKILPILTEYIEREHPLGLRVRELIQGELSLVPRIIQGKMDSQKTEYYRRLNRATTNYFLELEKIQAAKYK